MAPAQRKAKRDVYDLLAGWRLDAADPAANLASIRPAPGLP